MNKNDEWFTPKPIIEKVKKVFDGKIDLDPCSNHLANKRVKANFYYSKNNSCLDKDALWFGKVFVNPPYSNPELKKVLLRAIEEYELGRISEMIILTNSGTDTRWNQILKNGLQAYTIGRIRFITPEGHDVGTPSRGQVFTYYGKNKDKFIEVFKDNNFCWFPNLN